MELSPACSAVLRPVLYSSSSAIDVSETVVECESIGRAFEGAILFFVCGPKLQARRFILVSGKSM